MNHFLITMALFGLVSGWSCAQSGPVPANVRFERLTVDQGLSQSSVTTMLQDDTGFLWFGTQDGLNRFDGYHFKIYRHNPVQPSSISSSYIVSSYLDHQGVVWVGTTNGLNRYDEAGDRFTFHTLHPEGRTGPRTHLLVTAITQTPDRTLWVGTKGGLYQLNQEFLAKEVTSPEESSFIVTALYADQQHRLWIGTRRGLYLYDRQHITQPESWNPQLADRYILSLNSDARGRLWVGTATGLVLVQPEKPANVQPLVLTEGTQPAINHMVFDKHDAAWCLTTKGLFQVHKGEPVHYRHDPLKSYSLSENILTYGLLDQQGLLWFGSGNRGINKFNPDVMAFQHHYHDKNDARSLSDPNVSSVLLDSQNRLWVGTYNGLNRSDPDRPGRYTHYFHDAQKTDSLGHNDIMTLYEDREGSLWIGTYGGGLDRLQHRSTAFEHFRYQASDASGLSHNEVSTIIEDSKGVLWVGTFGGGINLRQPTKQVRFTQLRHSPNSGTSLSYDSIGALLSDENRGVWVGTLGHGLNLWNHASQSFQHYRHQPNNPKTLSQDLIFSLYLDERERLWVGTEGAGLNLMMPDGSFRHFNTNHGLPNNTVYKILGDNQGYLWLSTNRGLSRFDPRKEHFLNYQASDGLQGDEFNQQSGLKTPDGSLMFGGNNGLTLFHPNRLPINNQPPKVLLSDFLLLNQSVPILADGLLPQAIHTLKHLNLSHREDVLSFEFTALSFANPQKNSYAYKLEGLDETWVTTDATHRRATYTNLAPGHYVFRVKAANKDGVWNQEGCKLGLTVVPPIWRARFAWLLYGLLALLLSAVYLLVQKRARTRLQEEVANQTEKLHLRNDDLKKRNRELESLDQIVKTINREIAFDKVVQSLMEQGLLLFPNAQGAGFFKLDPTTNKFQFKASAGIPLEKIEQITLTPRQLFKDMVSVLEEIEEGIFRAVDFPKLPIPFIPASERPQSIITMLVAVEGSIQGILILANFQNPKAFNLSDVKMLKRFQSHVVSAVGKARIMRDLAAAQQELVEVAHSAGMAETAGEVLHNLGNTLNSINTTAASVAGLAGQEDALNFLKKITALLRGEEDPEAFMANDPRAGQIPVALERIGDNLIELHQQLGQQGQRLMTLTEDAMAVLRAQLEHAPSERLMEETDLNKIIQSSLELENYLLVDRGIRVELDLQPLPPIPLVRSKITRVLIYILKNACDAVDDQGESACITWRTRLEEQRISLEVIDNGHGIEPDNRIKAFNYGFTTRQGHQGFGLHFCANAMTEMGGQIELHTGNEGGTVVRLLFPVKPR